MPKRIGFLYERMISLENCVRAEQLMSKNKPDNRMAQRIGERAEEYGARLSEMLKSESWEPRPNRTFDLVDSYKGKTRHLKVPCLIDQSVQYAWLNIATEYIERRNYFYNCGSIPCAGQIRAVHALQRWLKTKKKIRYGQIADIRHFYETCPHWAVMRGLNRIFKDKRFLAAAERILHSMSDGGVGLAIGHPSSHWLANVALFELDHEIKRRFPDVKLARYMDDYAMLCNNKRHLRHAMDFLRKSINALGMEIKHTWQRFRIQGRGIKFLSYRFFHGYTLLSKPLMYRISRRIRQSSKCLNEHAAASVLSYMGILKHCNSYRFRTEHVYPFVSIKKCKEIVSNAKKNRIRKQASSI